MCDYGLVGICLTQPPAASGDSIFGFGEFLTALALLVLVYNSTDPLYRFRIAIAPLRLYPITFWTTLIVGAGSLLTDLWFQERWLAPDWGVSRGAIQAVLGSAFLALALTWTWFAFVRPASFGRLNARAYFQALYHAVVRGSESELSAVASELPRSAKALVRYAQEPPPRGPHTSGQDDAELPRYATQTLMLLGNRKLCRTIVQTSPAAAMSIMGEASRLKKYRLPLGQFAQNITIEALIDRDSRLYHEDDLSYSLDGYWQPFTTAMYSDFQLIDNTEGGSAFDIDYRVPLNAAQFSALCRIVLVTFDSYVKEFGIEHQSYVLTRAISKIGMHGSTALAHYEQLDDNGIREATSKFSSACDFVVDCISRIDLYGKGDIEILRYQDVGGINHSILDRLAETAFALICAASGVREPLTGSWHIQHNTAWRVFSQLHGRGSRVWRVFRLKLSRLLYTEIRNLETFPNWQSSAALYVVLNCIPLEGHTGFNRPSRAIAAAVRSWVRRNYIRLADAHPPVAEDCIAPRIIYDKAGARLVRTHLNGLDLTPRQEELQLHSPPAPASKRARRHSAVIARRPTTKSAKARP